MTDESLRLEPNQRRSVIITAAVKLANERGLGVVTFEEVARHCMTNTSPRTIRSYFKIGDLRKEILLDRRVEQHVRDDATAMGIV